MSRDYIRLRSNPEREKRLARAKDALQRIDDGIEADSATIDVALAALPQLVEIMEQRERKLKADADAVSGDALSLAVYPNKQIRDT